jgi:transcription elongation GreA/GreB family factor
VADASHEQLTRAQYDKLAEELAELEGPRRKAVVEAIATARAHGDLSENFEYHAAKNEQGLLERRIAILRSRLQHAEVIDEEAAADSPVGWAVIGRAEGDEVEVEAPRGTWKATIVSIRRSA